MSTLLNEILLKYRKLLRFDLPYVQTLCIEASQRSEILQVSDNLRLHGNYSRSLTLESCRELPLYPTVPRYSAVDDFAPF